MELPDIVEFARKFSVMVRINGPDPKGLKMRNHAFHQYHSGKTTLSASGLLLPHSLVGSEIHDKGAVIVTVASIVEPFLSQKSKLINAQGTPELIPGAQIDVMVEVNVGVENKDENPKWFGAKVLKLVDVPAASSAIKSLIEASSGSLEHGWEIGWSLAAHKDSSQKFKGSMQTQEITSSTERPRDVNMMAQFASRIAFLQVPSLLHKDLPEITMSYLSKRGDFLLSIGSPFGVLSPLHFFNSISVGSVSNCYPSTSMNRSLLMADIRCLPGMEGGPVFGQNGCLVGILNRPLRQAGGAEIQVVVPWKAIESACNGQFQLVPEKSERIQFVGDFCGVRTATMNCLNCRASPNVIEKQPVGYCSVPLTVEHAMSSVCLITLNNGVWASGILLNEQGLILTNAHLLEPWRFGRTPIQSGLGDTRIKNNFYMLDDSMPLRQAVEQTSAVVQSSSVQSLNYLRNSHGINPNHQVHSEISVRVDLMESWLWCKAKVVYISKGPLDISLLQLESVPKQLSPIRADLTFPSPGSKAFVIGHGLLGPRCDLLPTISSGVVAKVVKAKKHVPDQSTLLKSPAGEIPVMLETTAAVHPGGSGGAVINSSGHLIALVTSNAKHGGGTVIPHMNFSIPSAALEPVFKIAKDMQNLSVLQQLDRPNKDLTSVWAMMPSISPDPDPSLHSADDLLRKDEGKQSKGSQFAKFINEKKKLLGNSRHLNTMQNLSRDTISSKL
ncbi:glyoxysomal processing protease, glyoxysomal-like [Chenopodium quinoa]|uniref:glyoxysomal processing protease, glyoxysomal-like n=1 Tax=Chenopodium quinoa TaxID=63459 RepID=UPI000B78E4F3|nr:glyoxysomal processing protease, glyoxysomal-like [Chenopodium quinoa]